MANARSIVLVLLAAVPQLGTAQSFVNSYGEFTADDAVGISFAPDGFRSATRFYDAAAHAYRAKLLSITGAGGQISWDLLPGLSGGIFAQTMIEAADGGAFIAGSRIPPGASDHDGIVVRLSPNGTETWIAAPALLGDQQYFAVHELPDGGCIAAGVRNAGNGHDALVTRFTASGGVEWSTWVDDFSDVEALAVTAQGDDVMLTGHQRNFGGFTDAWIARLNGAGDIIWTSSWGGVRTEIGRAIKPIGPGAFLLAGTTNSEVPVDITENRRKDFIYLVAFDLNGDSLWTRAVGDTLFDRRGFDMDLAPNGDLLIVGERAAVFGASDAFAYRLSPTGGILWERAWDTGKEERLLKVKALADGFIGCGWSFGAASRQALLLRRNANGD